MQPTAQENTRTIRMSREGFGIIFDPRYPLRNIVERRAFVQKAR